MRKSLLESLKDLSGGADSSLSLEVFEETDGHVVEGVLQSSEGDWYPVIDGVPCFLQGELQPDFSEFAERHGLSLSGNQAQQSDRRQEQSKTNETFSDKWRRFKNYGHDPEHKDFLFGWYLKKLGVESLDDLKDFYRKRGRVLEVGPGSGFNTRFIAENCSGEVYALDVSEAANTTYHNTKDLENCSVVKADLMEAPFANDYFDFIIADGVLHHTPNTKNAVFALFEKVKPGGQFFFYIYRKMGAARQFSDSHIRESYMQMETEACYEACEGLTELGRELSKLNATITLEKPIDVLGIPAGTHDIQRLIYYNFVKCFWNDSFDYETNNMVNFDWYHPHNAWQHTEEEVIGWMDELGVTEYSFKDSNPNGISVLLTKP